MHIFETVKAAVSVKEAAERYGLKATRGSMACCPFHEDRNPSLKLNEDYFYCFGCGTHGDVIDLTSHLLGLAPYQAARQLAADFGVTADKLPKPVEVEKLNRAKKAQTFREKERLCFSVLSDYRRILQDWKLRYAPQDPGDPFHDRFAEACRQAGYVEYLLDGLLAGPAECADVVEMLTTGDWLADLRRRIDHLKEEEQRHERARAYSIAM